VGLREQKEDIKPGTGVSGSPSNQRDLQKGERGSGKRREHARKITQKARRISSRFCLYEFPRAQDLIRTAKIILLPVCHFFYLYVGSRVFLLLFMVLIVGFLSSLVCCLFGLFLSLQHIHYLLCRHCNTRNN
jgi:hypothetical protein